MDGFSLAELIVAVAITMFTVVTLVAVIRKGTDIRITSMHRERARAILDSCLESSAYHYTNFVNFGGANRTILIDPRDEGDSTDNLSGVLNISVSAVDTNRTQATPIGFKQVVMSVAWREPGESADEAIRIEKLITQFP